MKDVTLRLEGVSPLICNRFNDEAALMVLNGSAPAAMARDRGTPREQAEKKLYYGADEKTLMIPSPNILRSFYDGGAFHKIGKKQITTKKESLLCSCLFITASEIALCSKEGWRVDTRAVVIPSTGGRVMVHRPIFDDWALDIELQMDERIINEKLVRQIVDDAGSRIGLGDFRPARKGPYGRYVVTRWEINPVQLMAAE